MIRKSRLKKYASPKFVLIIGLLVAGVVSIAYLIPFVQGQHAKAAVKHFYELEQAGNFGESWELFHPQMHSKFSKDAYIQRRAHVFMHDFGVNTFRFDVGNPKKVSNWQMAEDTPFFTTAYEVEVAQHFKSAFGNFTVEQKVYVVNENNEWQILWQYY